MEKKSEDTEAKREVYKKKKKKLESNISFFFE